MSQSEPPPSIGLVGGKYQLVKMIGRGGMGSVWEARHASLGTPSAIKFIEAEYANSAEARSRFDKEAKAAATIQSKHAIQIYDHGVTDDGKPYIVMELLTGEPLDKRIDRLGSLKLEDTARIIQQVSRGLARAHERGIVHRDLKPENIFIVRNTDDDEEIAKVLDFGIAKIQNSPHSPGITSSTKTGAVLGTPFYMSPEQARGLRNVDHRTDVWSLGVIAFKCVTGRLPFDGESVGDLLVKICTAPIPIPSHSVPGLPQAFDTWFMRALEREPDRRFSSVTELSEHLAFAAGLGGRAATPHPGGLGSASGGPLGQQPMSATIAAASGQPNSDGRYGPPPNASVGSRTPHPAGMTAAPFTSSQPVPGASVSKWKWVVGAAAVGLLAAAALTGVAVAVKRSQQVAEQHGIVVTQSAGSDKGGTPGGVLSAAAGDNLGAGPATSAGGDAHAAPPDSASSAPGGGAPALSATQASTPPAVTNPLVTAPKPGGKPFTGHPKPPATHDATGGSVTPLPPPVVVAPPPPPPPATAKKPAKNDPGY